MTDDMYSLECWLRDKALEAHRVNNNLVECKDCPALAICDRTDAVCEDVGLIYECAMYNVLSYIQSRRVNQRPHIRITEEFDGSR